jgi:predicted cupin superfamily sugar epimerase
MKPRGVAAAELIRRYELAPHPEGGYFRESYRAAARLPARTLAGFPDERRVSTAIYFLLPRGAKSRLHRLKSDEVWHFYLGGALLIEEIDESGRAATTRLGADVAAGETLQHVVPAGRWFGASPAAGAEFSFVGCTVSPGFDFADFELGRRGALLERYPQARETIERLTGPAHD